MFCQSTRLLASLRDLPIYPVVSENIYSNKELYNELLLALDASPEMRFLREYKWFLPDPDYKALLEDLGLCHRFGHLWPFAGQFTWTKCLKALSRMDYTLLRRQAVLPEWPKRWLTPRFKAVSWTYWSRKIAQKWNFHFLPSCWYSGCYRTNQRKTSWTFWRWNCLHGCR